MRGSQPARANPYALDVEAATMTLIAKTTRTTDRFANLSIVTVIAGWTLLPLISILAVLWLDAGREVFVLPGAALVLSFVCGCLAKFTLRGDAVIDPHAQEIAKTARQLSIVSLAIVAMVVAAQIGLNSIVS
jgi:hypothetical protein